MTTTRQHEKRRGPEKIGVWRAAWRLSDLSLKRLLWPEGLPALVLGGGGAVLLVSASSVADRTGQMNNVVQLSAALLAVVFTALAIMVALPSGRYLQALQRNDPESDGMQRFLEPFLLALGVEVAVLLLALAYPLAAESVSAPVEHATFYVLGFLVVYGLLDVAALARSVVRHGIGRAKESVREAEREGTVARLEDRRSG
jgi:hypothetical protein